MKIRLKKKQKEIPFKCPRCGNQRIKNICDYCNWKGDEGPGAQLKEKIKELNAFNSKHCNQGL